MPQNDQKALQAALQREQGKKMLFNSSSTKEDKDAGLRLLIQASNARDPEALFLVARMILDGILLSGNKTGEDIAARMLCDAANQHYLPAQNKLAALCRQRYRAIAPAESDCAGPLKDFDGKPIQIDRSGILTPVDAHLAYENGVNVLTFSLNLFFLEDEEAVADTEKLHRAVIAGMKLWEGEYSVFGGQKLQVRVQVSQDPHLIDHVTVIVCQGFVEESIKRMLTRIPTQSAVKHRKALFEQNRAMAVMGRKKWSVKSRKTIFLQMDEGENENYDEIMHVVKHEFGHILGLGDLYAEPEAGQEGVPAGAYPELDCYRVGERFYHLVMCDHHGPVSNNDVEMVVLAFSRNQEQLYQPTEYNKTISEALGRGN